MTTPYIKILESLKISLELLASIETLDDLSPEDRETLEKIGDLAYQLDQRCDQLESEARKRSHSVQNDRSYDDGPWSTDKSLEKPFYLTEL